MEENITGRNENLAFFMPNSFDSHAPRAHSARRRGGERLKTGD
jgi:hypothetical protein